MNEKMKVIFKIVKHDPVTKSIVVQFARKTAIKPIDEFRRGRFNYEGKLDLYDGERFTKDLITKLGMDRIMKQERDDIVLRENNPEVLKGEFNIDDLIGRVFEGEPENYNKMSPIPMRRVEL